MIPKNLFSKTNLFVLTIVIATGCALFLNWRWLIPIIVIFVFVFTEIVAETPPEDNNKE